jgi:hypothetical protein
MSLPFSESRSMQPSDKPACAPTIYNTRRGSGEFDDQRNWGASESEVSFQTIDDLLEREKQSNKGEGWSKLDNSDKIARLHAFAERYAAANSLGASDVRALHAFFSSCLERKKLSRAKDVVYNISTKEVESIPALFFNTTLRAFTLKIVDTKRVSTLKSLTPKRATAKQMPAEDTEKA